MPAQKFVHHPTIVEAIQYDGTAASGREIVGWVFRSGHGGEAHYQEAEEAYTSPDGLQGRPASPAELCIKILAGITVVIKGDWVLHTPSDRYALFEVISDSEMQRLYDQQGFPPLPARIVADWNTGVLTVDGREFPYPVSSDVPFTAKRLPDDVVTVVSIPVLTEHFEHIGNIGQHPPGIPTVELTDSDD
ncbi:hypothetical protein CH300_20095 [Rhodococcus sp. 15-1154-1]|nr:hypothetical protein [Rhodococcus sp. 15-1154-1]OZF00844.1 hypothetical protein CH300_20095 [Rhodococcus sp. 15-1154-1]